jgi:hypothetical protein
MIISTIFIRLKASSLNLAHTSSLLERLTKIVFFFLFISFSLVSVEISVTSSFWFIFFKSPVLMSGSVHSDA